MPRISLVSKSFGASSERLAEERNSGRRLLRESQSVILHLLGID